MLRPIIRIAKYTLTDEVRQRSFVVMFAMSVIFVFLIRGCYHGNYMVNGRALEAGAVIGAVSKVTFHIVAVVVMLIAALLSMRAFRRDRDEGMQSAILSKPITRRQYVIGKILGLWVVSTIFMFILHAILFVTVSITSKVVVAGYLVASLLCSFNLLFVVVAVLLLSLLMPDIVAFLSILGIGIVGSVTDGIYALSHSRMVQTMMTQPDARPQSDLSLSEVVHYVWPKVSGAQAFASSFIGSEGFYGAGSVFPLFNIVLYCIILSVLLFRRFGNEEIV
jgi:ABC-type transport system involved in multi-copper enzyme maturation permease subunit